MTDIAVFNQPLQSEDLSWDLTPPHGGFDQQGVLGIAAFTQAQHFPNGYIPAGTVLAKGTSGTFNGLLIPYLDAGTLGASAAVGILKASVKVVQPNGAVQTKVGCAYRVHGMVSVARLPFTVGNAAAGGYIDANGQADLKFIYFAA